MRNPVIDRWTIKWTNLHTYLPINKLTSLPTDVQHFWVANNNNDDDEEDDDKDEDDDEGEDNDKDEDKDAGDYNSSRVGVVCVCLFVPTFFSCFTIG